MLNNGKGVGGGKTERKEGRERETIVSAGTFGPSGSVLAEWKGRWSTAIFRMLILLINL